MVGPVTRNLVLCLLSNRFPDSPAAIADFGIESPEHFRALRDALRGGVTPEMLDAALGDGQALTALVNGRARFHTVWDDLARR